MGTWGGSMNNKSVEINFIPGKIFPFDSLFLALSLKEDGYSLFYEYIYDQLVNNYSEIGNWNWDEDNPGSLTFETTGTHTLKYRLTGPLVNDNYSGDGTYVLASWGSDFEYVEGTITDLRFHRATLKLYHTSGPLDFGDFTLIKR